MFCFFFMYTLKELRKGLTRCILGDICNRRQLHYFEENNRFELYILLNTCICANGDRVDIYFMYTEKEPRKDITRCILGNVFSMRQFHYF